MCDLAAVSYTHLDVYKRQIGMFASFDPLALDQACADACLAANPLPGSRLSDNMARQGFVDLGDLFQMCIRDSTGRAETAPYRKSKRDTACARCDYASVCGFDPAFGGCAYRSVRTVKADAFLEEARHETVDE